MEDKCVKFFIFALDISIVASTYLNYSDMIRSSFLAVIFLVCFSWDAFAQFSLSADIRPRAEYRKGYRVMPGPDDQAAVNVSQRTRLIMGFNSEHITTRVSFQDVRIWGQHLPFGQTAALDLHEAWLQLALGDQFSVKAGRQEIRYDNQRFFAINDWNQSAQKHDALVISFKNQNNEVHFGNAFNQSSDRLFGTPYYMNNYKTLHYLWYKTGLSSGVNLSLLGVADGYEHPEDPGQLSLRTTASAFLEVNAGLISLRANPALQGGKTARGENISAWYFMLQATANLTGKVRSELGVEVFSGINYEDPDNKYRAFSPLYGAGHTVQGYMDYFTNVTAHTRGAGLINPYLKNRFLLSEKTSFDADLHLFFLQNNFVHQGNVIDKYLGTEIDFTLSHSINPVTSLVMGYSVMFGTESMEVIKGGSKDEFAHWGFVMIRVRPRFL